MTKGEKQLVTKYANIKLTKLTESGLILRAREADRIARYAENDLITLDEAMRLLADL